MPPTPLPTTTFTNNYRYTIYDNYTVNSRITSTKSANVTTAKATYYISHSCIQDLSHGGREDRHPPVVRDERHLDAAGARQLLR